MGPGIPEMGDPGGVTGVPPSAMTACIPNEPGVVSPIVAFHVCSESQVRRQFAGFGRTGKDGFRAEIDNPSKLGQKISSLLKE
jgi:hypothetical protein